MMWKFAAIPLALLFAACTPTESATADTPVETLAVHPVSGLDVIPLTITADGKTHEFDVEITRTDEDRRQGLMFRRELGPDEGMLFTYPESLDGSCFWMKNTVIPLDIVFFDDKGTIVDIHAERQPYSLECRAPEVRSWGAVEIPGGRAAELGIEAGDVVAWDDPKA